MRVCASMYLVCPDVYVCDMSVCHSLSSCLTLSMLGALLDAVDRTVPEAYTKRSRGVTEKRAELLSEGLFNTLLLSVRGHFRERLTAKRAPPRRDKHNSPKLQQKHH